MTGTILFEFPPAWLGAVPLAVLLALGAWRQYRRGLNHRRIIILTALRSLALVTLVALAARPIWMAKEPPASASRWVVLLMDRSESMSLEETAASRYQQAVGFLRERLLPALNSARLPVQATLFDQGAEPADGSKLESTAPKGQRTNLGGAIAQALGSSPQQPLALIALTDG